MNILELLKNGKTVEDITEDFFTAMEESQAAYEKWKEEEEEKRRAAAQRALELEYKKSKQEQARKALGAAIVDYFSSLDIKVTEKTLEEVEWIIDALPQIKVVRTWR